MLPVTSLLGQALVAFTIEHDLLVEQRLPHRTTRGPAREARGPWLVSRAMWVGYLREVGGGRPRAELRAHERITNLAGLQRWGYLRIADGQVRPTRWCRAADEVFRPLAAEVEQRWAERFGAGPVGEVRAALEAVVDGAAAAPDSAEDVDGPGDSDGAGGTGPAGGAGGAGGAGEADGTGRPGGTALPDCFPVAGMARLAPTGWPPGTSRDLDALLARTLLARTLAFEREAGLSLAVCSTALRVLPDDGVATRDLPALAGVATEAAGLAVRVLARAGLVTADPDPAHPRTTLVRRTARGTAATARYRRVLAEIDEEHRDRHGARLPAALTTLLANRSALVTGLTPHPESWRANPPYARRTEGLLADPAASLPHHPLVSHRGGFPDGA